MSGITDGIIPRPQDPKSLAEFHAPVYRIIEQDFRQFIRSGKWSAGAMIPSRHLLAREYCVDVRTIQRAISDLLADGTLYAEGGRGTYVAMPNGHPSVQSSHKRAVMVIAEQSCNPSSSWPALIKAVHEGLRKHLEASSVLTFNTTDRTLEGVILHERAALRLAEKEGYSGVIMFHCGGDATLTDIQRTMDSDVPIVFIDRLPFELGCNFVGVDNRSGAREAVEFLLSLGHRRIAFVAPGEKVSTITDRLHGYLDAFMSVGMPPPTDLIYRISTDKSFSRQGLHLDLCGIIEEMMDLAEPPMAVFAVNDFIAEHLVLAAQELGISVPESLSVVGFDDAESFLTKKPKLTSVRQPFDAIGDRAAAMLRWQLNQPMAAKGAYQHVVLSTKLVIRDSAINFAK